MTRYLPLLGAVAILAAVVAGAVQIAFGGGS